MKEPFFWSAGLDPKSREAAPLTRMLLTPLAWIYGLIAAEKISAATPIEVSAKVICVGNISVGGVGKSPVVAALRSMLSAHPGLRVATLSRGYGGKLKGPLRVDTSHHTARDVGDEPYMLAQNGETWIGADRGAAGKMMSNAGVDIIIMDDGHQNPSLNKDISLVVVDTRTAFGNGYVIPKGPLRETISAGLARADAVIVMGDGDIPSELSTYGGPILRAKITSDTKLAPGPYVGFAGIGYPQKFFDTLTDSGVDLRDSVPFPDHHIFTSRDMNYLRELARDHKAHLITTEKDLARMTPEQKHGVVALPVKAQFEDTDALGKLLGDVLKTQLNDET